MWYYLCDALHLRDVRLHQASDAHFLLPVLPHLKSAVITDCSQLLAWATTGLGRKIEVGFW